MRRRTAKLAAVPAAAMLAGCVVVPVAREVYDPDCRMMRREVALEAAVIGQMYGCNANECAAVLATLGVVGAASLVVSGSIAVVGNIVYFLEHEANCRRLRGPETPDGPRAPQAPRPPQGQSDQQAG
jgi:hypothetical protein